MCPSAPVPPVHLCNPCFWSFLVIVSSNQIRVGVSIKIDTWETIPLTRDKCLPCVCLGAWFCSLGRAVYWLWYSSSAAHHAQKVRRRSRRHNQKLLKGIFGGIACLLWSNIIGIHEIQRLSPEICVMVTAWGCWCWIHILNDFHIYRLKRWGISWKCVATAKEWNILERGCQVVYIDWRKKWY